MPPISIRIKGYTFQLSAPYHAGTVITEAEAQALNDLRAENIQNNTRKHVIAATAELGPGELIPQPQLDALQQQITEYDRNYQFSLKTSPRPRLSDIDREKQVVARELAEARLRQGGLQPTEEAIDQMAAELTELSAVVEEARDRVAARRRVLADTSLAGLLE